MKTIKIETKNRWSGKVLFEYSSDNNTTKKTVLEAIKSGADLRGADLSGADLRGADLSGADLRGAYLRDAIIEEPLYLPDIYSLKLLPPETPLRFWKYLENGESPYQRFCYLLDTEYVFDDIDLDETNLCGTGGNVATLVWCLKDSSTANEFMEVEFTVADIGAIPYATDGKFRVKRFKTLRIINREEAVQLLKDAMVQ